jgi:hypothetical protein
MERQVVVEEQERKAGTLEEVAAWARGLSATHARIAHRFARPEPRRREELADFLRTRRARLTPAEVGLPTGFRRNTPGLRRNEVASLAGVIEPWYTWLEQGRDIHPSAQVLEGIGRALRLNADEQAYLVILAQRGGPAQPPAEIVSPLVQRMLSGLLLSPAFVRGRRDDILAWNEAADAVFEFSGLPADTATASGSSLRTSDFNVSLATGSAWRDGGSRTSALPCPNSQATPRFPSYWSG